MKKNNKKITIFEKMNDGLRSQFKTKKQRVLKKIKQELKELMQEEDKINAQRKEHRKISLNLMTKDYIKLFVLSN